MEELYLELKDTEWPLDFISHDRTITRAIVFDDEGMFYFAHITRDDEFGCVSLIETSGGGVKNGEDLHTAVRRELKEELGVHVDILCRIGVVSDYYNLIHRHNINNYFLCRITSFTENDLTEAEREQFHLSTIKLTYDEAVTEYSNGTSSMLGRLIANRELPILKRAKELISEYQE